jgi:stearoyl-CoA desaturase (delta-9 desaturase)
MSVATVATGEPSGRVNRIGEKVSLGVFLFIHLACLAAIWTGVTWRAVGIAVALYWVRMFAVTAGYHRYFAHRSFKTSRAFQFLLALVGTTCVQKGPLWWASVHRRHHRASDGPGDVHSPVQRGFWWSHVGWVVSDEHVDTDVRSVRDLARYPELVWLGTYHWVAPLTLAFACWLVAGWSGLIVGFACSTAILWHCTFTINSLAHVFGKRRYATTDASRNNWLLALITLGEGWHNNHHRYMNSVNQGFFWWEVDVSYYVLRALAAVGVVWDLRRPPARVLVEGALADAAGATRKAPSAASLPA